MKRPQPDLNQSQSQDELEIRLVAAEDVIDHTAAEEMAALRLVT